MASPVVFLHHPLHPVLQVVGNIKQVFRLPVTVVVKRNVTISSSVPSRVCPLCRRAVEAMLRAPGTFDERRQLPQIEVLVTPVQCAAHCLPSAHCLGTDGPAPPMLHRPTSSPKRRVRSPLSSMLSL
mmetsp:Transcript_32949/g.77267  ORF Transcript_32949/g.77267 Transcript_32949/m.77267 type:complete len:127 (+) Transcript_32949:288-668(+)